MTMTILKICLTLCLILFGSTFAHGEAVEVQCSLSPESGFIGDLFTYEVVLPRGKGYTLEAPEFPPDLEQVEVTLTEEGETLRLPMYCVVSPRASILSSLPGW